MNGANKAKASTTNDCYANVSSVETNIFDISHVPDTLIFTLLFSSHHATCSDIALA